MANLSLGGLTNIAQSGISPIANVFMLFGRSPQEWDITEASYEGVTFHVFEKKQSSVTWQGALGKVIDRGGRRKAKIMFPYRDGQTTDDLGRAPETFELDIVMFGNDYKQGLTKLFEKLQLPTPGTLIHPVRGSVKCVMDSYENLHSHEQSKAVNLKLIMIEHSFSLSSVAQLKNKISSSLSYQISKCLKAFATIDNVLNDITATVGLANSIKTIMKDTINNYKNLYASALASINRAFNPDGKSDVAILLPVNEGGVQRASTSNFSVSIGTAQTQIISDRFRTTISPDDPFAKVPVSLLDNQTQKAVAALQVQKLVNQTRALLQIILQELSQAAVDGEPGLSVSANGEAIFAESDTSGSLYYYDNIVALKQTALDLQTALETGLASSKVRIIKYSTPRIMTLREVAFANGLDVNRVNELDLLNPTLFSINYIEKDVEVLVPV